MGAEVVWDQKSQNVMLTSGGTPSYLDIFTPEGQPPMTKEDDEIFLREVREGVEAELRPDIGIVLDGVEQNFTNTRGEPVYPLVIRECIYLPVRNVGELCGKEVLWMPKVAHEEYNRLYIYDTMTPEQQQVALDYFDRCAKQYAGLQDALDALAVARDLTEETFRGQLEELNAQVSALRDLQWPGVPVLEYNCNAVSLTCRYLIENDIAPYLNPETGLRPEFVDASWQEHRDSFINSTRDGDNMRLLGSAIAQSQRIVDALIANQGRN